MRIIKNIFALACVVIILIISFRLPNLTAEISEKKLAIQTKEYKKDKTYIKTKEEKVPQTLVERLEMIQQDYVPLKVTKAMNLTPDQAYESALQALQLFKENGIPIENPETYLHDEEAVFTAMIDYDKNSSSVEDHNSSEDGDSAVDANSEDGGSTIEDYENTLLSNGIVSEPNIQNSSDKETNEKEGIIIWDCYFHDPNDNTIIKIIIDDNTGLMLSFNLDQTNHPNSNLEKLDLYELADKMEYLLKIYYPLDPKYTEINEKLSFFNLAYGDKEEKLIIFKCILSESIFSIN